MKKIDLAYLKEVIDAFVALQSKGYKADINYLHYADMIEVTVYSYLYGYRSKIGCVCFHEDLPCKISDIENEIKKMEIKSSMRKITLTGLEAYNCDYPLYWKRGDEYEVIVFESIDKSGMIITRDKCDSASFIWAYMSYEFYVNCKK